MNKVLAKLIKWATVKNITILIVIFILFNVIVWRNIAARLDDYSGGMGALDTRFSYSPQKAYQMISAYGEEGRRFYTIVDLTADLIYPLTTALLFSLLATYVFRRAFTGNKVMQVLTLLPVIPMVTDYLENIGVVIMLNSYPVKLTLMAQVTSLMTSIKYITIRAMAAMIVLGLAVWVLRKTAEAVSKEKLNPDKD